MTPTHRLARNVADAGGWMYAAGRPVELVSLDSGGLAIVDVSRVPRTTPRELIRVPPSCLEPIPPRQEPPA